MITRKITLIATLAVIGIAICAPLRGQQAQKPLTNLDVIKMVQVGLPESVVISTIQSRPAKFNTSPDRLIALHKAGVTPGEMEAIMAASGKGPSSSSGNAAAPAASASADPVAKSHRPTVMLIQNGASQPMPLEKTQLAQTKTKPTSMKSLAGAQGLQAGIGTATTGVAQRSNSVIGGTVIQEGGSIFSGIMGNRKPTVTYVWGVTNPASSTVLQTDLPKFQVDFSRAMRVNVDDYEPAIVRLTPAQNTCRIVGATEGKEDLGSSPAADWEVYSHFLEERVAAPPKKLGPGKYEISPSAELEPGEYAVVLRPISKSKKFSGGDVMRAQGDGLLFDAAWTFQISDSAE
jgi:hypothetical protein